MWWILAQQTQTNKKPHILDVPNAKKKKFLLLSKKNFEIILLLSPSDINKKK